MTPEPPHSPPASASKPRRILLVGWDAADWRVISPLLDAGKMPALAKLIEHGVMGNLSTLHPMISPMLWTSIVTGKTADKHGILGFTEADPSGRLRPVASTSRRTKALWNILQQALGWRCNVIAWWASHPAEPLHGTVVTDYFRQTRPVGAETWRVPPGSIHPANLADEFGPLRMLPAEVTEELVLPFIPRAAEIDQSQDRMLEAFVSLLSECLTTQAVATAAMERAEWEFTAVYFDAIDHFSHSFMPFHPPRQAHIPEEPFELYQGVVESIYRLQDLMLARLVELAGPETLVVVCSDHGFQSGDLRPLGNPQDPAGPIFWHREYGMIVLSGPGVRRDERIYGATLLDVTPTILALVGLPAGADMDGKVLTEAIEGGSVPERIPSWDQVEGDTGEHPPGFTWENTTEDSEELLQQFAALGYIEDPSLDRGAGVKLESQYNASQVLLSSGRALEAVEVMEKLVQARPWESRYLHQLANAYLKAGYYLAADRLLAQAYPPATEEDTPLVAWILRARAKLGLEERDAAIDCLRRVMQTMLRLPSTWVETGWLWVQLKQWGHAEVCFQRAVELDAESATGWEGLAMVRLHRRDNQGAIDAALEAVQLLYQLPQAHFYLGVALAREEKLEEAIVAFRRTIVMRPDYVPAHRWLAALYRTRADDEILASTFAHEAQRQSQNRVQDSQSRRSRARVERAVIGPLPSPAERLARIQQARPNLFAPGEAEPSGRTFIIVSGLPRSGTSLMMQMLEAGGVPLLTDGARVADVDNPRGYFEWEPIKQIGQHPEALDAEGLDGRAIKCISMLLRQLPRKHHYKIIFLTRDIAEVVQSQAAMLRRRGEKGAELDEKQLQQALTAHRDETRLWLRSVANAETLELDHHLLVSEPHRAVERLQEFLGPERLPRAGEMAAVIDRALYRRRAESAKKI